MKTIPMIFNQQMVQALVDGRKTVTRRLIKGNPKIDACGNFIVSDRNYGQDINGNPKTKAFTHFHGPCRLGDLIWVRETLEINCYLDGYYLADNAVLDLGNRDWHYRNPEYVGKVPSIHMPRWASRLTLRVTDVRCERLQQVDKQQAQKEGVNPTGCTKGFWVTAYQMLWDSIYSNWDENPWVWVIEFEVIKSNVDKVINNEH